MQMKLPTASERLATMMSGNLSPLRSAMVTLRVGHSA
jgi:hypothetical protein